MGKRQGVSFGGAAAVSGTRCWISLPRRFLAGQRKKRAGQGTPAALPIGCWRREWLHSGSDSESCAVSAGDVQWDWTLLWTFVNLSVLYLVLWGVALICTGFGKEEQKNRRARRKPGFLHSYIILHTALCHISDCTWCRSVL